MLRRRTGPPRSRAHGLDLAGVHDAMYSRLLGDRFLTIALRNWRCGRDAGDTTTIPDAADVVARNDLGKATRFDVPDLDETAVEQ